MKSTVNMKAFFFNELKSRSKVIALAFYIGTEKTPEYPRSASDFHPSSLSQTSRNTKRIKGSKTSSSLGLLPEPFPILQL